MGYGIERVPDDVDRVAEDLANLDAATRQPSRRATLRCCTCGAPTDTLASLGPACPEHYDELSD